MDKHYIVKKSTVHWLACIVAVMVVVATLVKYTWLYVQTVLLHMVLVFFVVLFMLLMGYMVFWHGKRR